MMNEELKPCPFCGGKAMMDEDLGKWFGKCLDCHIEGDWFHERELAVNAWNTRYEPTCKMEYVGSHGEHGIYRCSNCGAKDYESGNYCRNCRAKVEQNEPTCTMEKVLLYDEECVEGIECDQCGWGEIHDHSEPIPYTHCPNCKAKVDA